MGVDITAHRVAKVVIEKSESFRHGERDCSARSIVIVFENGSTQKLELFAADSAELISVEVR